jgi:hypothetical protein
MAACLLLEGGAAGRRRSLSTAYGGRRKTFVVRSAINNGGANQQKEGGIHMNTSQKDGRKSVMVAPGWTLADAEEAIVESTIDFHRFASPADRTLARIEGDEGLSLFPSTEVLAGRGINVAALAVALNNGLKPTSVAELVDTFEVDTVNGLLERFHI